MFDKANWVVGQMELRQKAEARAQLLKLCGAVEGLTLDHKLARAHGGMDGIDNLQVLCARGSSGKGLTSGWRKLFGVSINVMVRDCTKLGWLRMAVP